MVGEAVYVTLGRSADFTVASQWWSKRGFAPSGIFRYRGPGADFGTFRVHSLLDEGVWQKNGQRGQNQGGVDVGGDGRYDFSPHTTGVIDAEYLSSYIYRLVFEEDYALAINSEVKSQMFVTHESRDVWASLRFSRYQDFQSASMPGDEVRILHLPTIEVEAADRRLGGAMSVSPVWWGFSGSAGEVSRFDYPNFRTSAGVQRVDLYPRLSMPLHFDGMDLPAEMRRCAGRGTERASSRRIWSSFRWCGARGCRGPTSKRGSTCGRRCWSGIFQRRGWCGCWAAICGTPSSRMWAIDT